MPDTATSSRLEPLVSAWLEKISFSKKSPDRRAFDMVAKQCDAFYRRETGFLWSPSFKSKYLGAMSVPNFKISLNKAFEFVALYGPTLYWKYPKRRIELEDPIKVNPALFGDPNDPQVQQQMQMLQQQQMQRQMTGEMRVQLAEKYLNYTQREQPQGGLSWHTELSMNEAMVKGRGILWPETYRFPGSNRVLTGLFHDSIDNFGVDADCHDPGLESAQFIYREHVDPIWKVERRFNLPYGLLEAVGGGNLESLGSLSGRRSALDKTYRKNGKTNDLMVWYEVWSKNGIGARLTGGESSAISAMPEGLSYALENAVGDYAYLCVAKNIPWPLNAPTQLVMQADDDEIQQMFQWRAPNYGKPFPCYLDDRWPVAILDFYKVYNSAWPLAPLGPGLGELICLNVLIGAYVEQAYENRRLIIAVLKSAAQDVRGALEGSKNPAVVEINQLTNDSIEKMIQYLQRPNMNSDIIGAIQYLSEMFDKRVGLSDIQYGQATRGAQSRSARDIAAKQEAAGLRPEKMSGDVAKWQSCGAQLELFLARWSVTAQDLVPLLGQEGAMMWQQLIENEDPEVVVREMRVVIDAVDVRRPNKEQQQANLSQMGGFYLPEASKQADVTGDTTPLNKYIEAWAETMEMDGSEWAMGPRQPQPPPPEVQQQQQQMAELEARKTAAEAGKLEADAQHTIAEMQQMGAEQQAEQAKAALEMHKKQMELQFDQIENEQELRQRQDEHRQKLDQSRTDAIQKVLAARMQADQQLSHDRAMGDEKLDALRDLNDEKLEAARKMAAVQRQAAAQKPKTNGKTT